VTLRAARPWLPDKTLADRRAHALDRARTAHTRALGDLVGWAPDDPRLALITQAVFDRCDLVLEVDAEWYASERRRLVRYQRALLRVRAQLQRAEHEIAGGKRPPTKGAP
jgi:hypothetical protein